MTVYCVEIYIYINKTVERFEMWMRLEQMDVQERWAMSFVLDDCYWCYNHCQDKE